MEVGGNLIEDFEVFDTSRVVKARSVQKEYFAIVDRCKVYCGAFRA